MFGREGAAAQAEAVAHQLPLNAGSKNTIAITYRHIQSLS